MGDPRAFIAAAVAILADYPASVVGAAVLAIPQRSDRPTLKLIRSVCDEIHAPLLREAERRARHQSRPLPQPKRTAEQQARIDAQVAAAKQKLAAAMIESDKKGASR